MEKQIIAKRDASEGHDATRTALIFAGLFALVALSYAFLDRQVASGLRPYTHGVQLFIWMTYIVNPLIPLASIAAAFIGAALVRGSLTPLTEIPPSIDRTTQVPFSRSACRACANCLPPGKNS